MKNADKFKSIFGIYATELWAKSEEEFLEWLNSETEEQEKAKDAVPVRHGEWTRHVLGSTGYGTTVMHQCSECECMTISRYRYCPNCGAKMDGAEREKE